MKFLLLLFVFVICLSACQTVEHNGTDYLKKGIDAYQRNDYKRAANLWNKACDKGVANACGIVNKLQNRKTKHFQNHQKVVIFSA